MGFGGNLDTWFRYMHFQVTKPPTWSLNLFGGHVKKHIATQRNHLQEIRLTLCQISHCSMLYDKFMMTPSCAKKQVTH